MDTESPADQLFRITADACRYFPGQEALLQLTSLRPPFSQVNVMTHTEDQERAEHLLEQGQVPSFEGFEKTNCFGCNACIPARIDLSAFKADGRRGRLLAVSSDFRFSLEAGLPQDFGQDTRAHAVRILQDHRRSRFGTGTMDEAEGILDSLGGFPGFSPYTLLMYKTGADGKQTLAGYMILLHALHSLYAVLHAYDPAHEARSPGNMLVLKTIEVLKGDAGELPARGRHLYLGNWTPRPSRLSWKEQYAPLELRLGKDWVSCDRKALDALKKPTCSIRPKQA